MFISLQMNWLAHVFLSGSDIDHRIGNLVADLVKGRPWSGISESGIRGIELHKFIDSFTDSNPIAKTSISRLGPSGRLRGVVIDILYDHMLSKNWDTFCTLPLETYLSDFYGQIDSVKSSYSLDIQEFLTEIVESKKLGLYGDLNNLPETLLRIDKRLSSRVRQKETASQYHENVIQNYSSLEEDFLAFFPELQQAVDAQMNL